MEGKRLSKLKNSKDAMENSHRKVDHRYRNSEDAML